MYDPDAYEEDPVGIVATLAGMLVFVLLLIGIPLGIIYLLMA